MTDLKEYIKQKRPNLSATSVNTYNSILTNLYKTVFADKEINVSKFNESDIILNHIRLLPPNRRKTILSALVIITDDKAYRDLMMEDINDYKSEIAKQEKTPSKKENWIETAQVKQLWEQLKRNADLLYKKSHLTTNDLQQIQSYIILSLLGGIFVVPRRALDYVNFKTKNINKEKDNYLDKATLIFNSYKTAKFYGEQRVKIPPTLKYLLTKWMKVNPTDYLLFDTNMNPLTSVKLNQRLNKLFEGKKVGVNSLRHTYLSDKYGSTIQTTKDLATDLTNMGSSMSQAQTYIKEA
jgi:integrase